MTQDLICLKQILATSLILVILFVLKDSSRSWQLLSNIDIFASHLDLTSLNYLFLYYFHDRRQACQNGVLDKSINTGVSDVGDTFTEAYSSYTVRPHLSAAQIPAESDTNIFVLHTGWK